MDAEQRASIADEGFDPDNRAVVVAMLRMHELLAHIGCICGRGQNVGKIAYANRCWRESSTLIKIARAARFRGHLPTHIFPHRCLTLPYSKLPRANVGRLSGMLAR